MNTIPKLLLEFLLVLALLGMVIAPRFPSAETSSRIIRVKHDFDTIQEAINNANQGDTILVSAGVYYEHVLINKTVSLIGESNEATVIDGSNSSTVVQITSNAVSISGFKIQNSGYGWTRNGVYVHHANNCKIENNHFVNDCHNIRLNFSRNSQVIGNVINGTMYGIRLMNSFNCTAINNTISNCVGGIHLENATNCYVAKNYCTQNGQGIRLYTPCTNNLITANMIRNNIHDGMIALMPENTTYQNNNFYHNNFVNNTNPFIIQSTGTNWDDGYEGNYWTRYNGSDSDRNGIGDTPYDLEIGRDNHPLMGYFSEFTFQSTGRTYTATTICNSNITNFSFEPATNSSTIKFELKSRSAKPGFCRMAIPRELMNYPFTILVDNNMEANTTLKSLQEGSNPERIYLYFSHAGGSHKVALISGSPKASIWNTWLPVVVLISITVMASVVFFLRKKLHQKRLRVLSRVTVLELTYSKLKNLKALI